MSKKLPSFQFYPGDWMKDPAVRCCSLAARGLWIDLLCLMHESPRRGYLQHENGMPVTHEQIARMTGCSSEEASHLLQELESAGVFSCTEHGVIYSRRAVRDEDNRTKTKERVKRYRKSECNATCNADVTPDVTQMKRSCNANVQRSSVSSSVSVSEKEKKEKKEISPHPSFSSPVTKFENSMMPGYTELAEHWKSLGQVLDLRSREGIQALMELGRPIDEIKSAMTGFEKARRKAKPEDWLATCTLKGMADGHYSEFVDIDKPEAAKRQQPKLISIRCPECKTVMSVYSDCEKVKCVNQNCEHKFLLTEKDTI